MARHLVPGRLAALLVASAMAWSGTIGGPPPARAVEPTPSAAPAGAPSAEPSPTPVEPAPSVEPPATPTPAPAEPAPGIAAGATELESLRTETSQTFDNHDGTYTARFYAAPAFYRPQGRAAWEPIEVGFLAGTERDALTGLTPVLTSERAPVVVSLFDPGARDFLAVSDGTAAVGFGLPDALAKAAAGVAPTLADGHADFPGILAEGAGLRVFPRAQGSKAFVVLDRVPAEPRWTFRVHAPGLTLVPREGGYVDLVDAAGAVVGWIPQPYAVDSSLDEARGGGIVSDGVTLAVGADADGTPTITLVADPAFLARATYPVYVDPTVEFRSTSDVADAHTASGYPSQNFASYQRPTSPTYYEMWLGTDPSGTSGTSYDFLRFDVSSIAGTTVDTTYVSMYPWHQYYDAPTEIRTWIAIVDADESWTETGVKWNNQPDAGANVTFIDAVEGEYSTSESSSSFKAAVQGWVSGTATNRGIREWENGYGSTYWKRQTSSENGGTLRPALTISYHLPTATPAAPVSGALTNSSLISWTYADAGGAAQTRYQVEVDTAADFASPLVASSGDVASSAKAWSIPVTLTPGTTYYWRVKASNGTSWSAWSSAASFVAASPAALGQPAWGGFETWDLGAGDSLAVNTATGNVHLSHPVVSLPIRAGSLELTLAYNSADATNVGMGPGWRLNVSRRLAVNADGSVTFTDADGARHTFTNPQGGGTVTYTRPATLYATLVRDTTATPDRFTLTYRDQSKDVFDEDLASTGLLKQVKDRHGNTVSLAYTAGTARISTMSDPAGRTVSFTWDGSYRLTTIVDWAVVSGGIVQASGTGNRTHRFFYEGANAPLIGWSDPLTTSGSCPANGSHLTCLTYTGGLVTKVSKTQTYTTFSSGTLGTATRLAETQVAYAGADVTSVTDAEGAATAFSHPASGQTKVVRPGTPASETTYALVAATDSLGRVASVKRKLGAAQIETETTYDATYPIEPAIITENKGGGALERTTSFTYQASSLGLLSRLDEPLDGTYRRYTDYTYNANNDATQVIVSRQGDATLRTTTRSCYTASGCSTSATDLLLRSVIENYVDGTAGGANGHVEDVTTTFQYDAYGQRTRETRANYAQGGTLLDAAATGWTYDTYGNLTSEIRNYASGTVTNPGDDVTPNGTTNARTDLTTAYAYDTAGNRISSADPRRAIEAALGTNLAADDFIGRTAYDALGQVVTTRLPTTPGQADCGSPPGCRETATAYDELGLVRSAADINDLVTATRYDRAGRAVETYEDPAPAGSASITSLSTYDAAGRVLTAKDRRQAADASLGSTLTAYDELGRVTDVTEAYQSSPDLASITHSTYDALGRRLTEETGYGTGTGQTTTWTYDIGDRATATDDEFTCATTTYDWRGLAQVVTEGLDHSTCGGTALRVITHSHDALGRLTRSEITWGEGDDDVLAAPTYDAAGHQLSTSATKAGVTTSSTFTFNPLDQPTGETRADGGTASSWTKANFDPAGNPTDRCAWSTNPGSELCKTVGSSFTTAPAVHTTTAYDARDNRISLKAPGLGETTYDPAHDYQVAAVYVPTGAGKEHQTLYDYDERHRLTGITQQLCTISSGHACSATDATGSDDYAYDDNDSRTRVTAANGAGSLDRHYCYDALDRIIATRSAAGCSSGLIEAYTYDDAGNRASAGATSFTYDAQGQLSGCSNPSCGSVTYDDAGRTATWNGWSLSYDGEGRLASACTVAGCATGDMVTMRYDGAGRRVELVTRPGGGATTTTTLRYQGDAVALELTNGTLSRTYVTDEAGRIVKVCDPDCSGSNPAYLVTWNGHGDALALWRIEASGSLTLANSYTYTTWGAPTTATHNSHADLGFRYLYVGAQGVAWDNLAGLGLLHMGARHYSPALGRFLQPDPSAAEANLYAYGENSPVTKVDPSGLLIRVLARLTVIWTHWGGRNYTYNFRWTQSRPTPVTAVRVDLDHQWFDFIVQLWEYTGITAFKMRFGAQTSLMTANSGLFRARCGERYRYWYTVATDPNVVIIGMPGTVGLGFAQGQVGNVFKFC